MTSRFPSQSRVPRPGFTLVELLVVMAVIGILIGLLVPVLGPVFWRTSEFVIQTEQNQMESAVESFNTEYGFYPQDFSNISTWDQFLPYLNKIAPNHNELSLDPGGSGLRRIERWWVEVGQYLNPTTALPFWLSGIRNSAQYPLTHPETGVPATAYAFDGGSFGERIDKFDFKSNRLIIGQPPLNKVAQYGQAKGNQAMPYVYFNAGYLDLGPDGIPGSGDENASGLKEQPIPPTNETVVPYRPDPTVPGPPFVFFEPNKFQIIAPGLDNRYGAYNPPPGPYDWTTVTNIKTHRDNVVTFKRGRMDRDIE